MTSITRVGVLKGHDILTWRAPDGVKCSSSAYAKSRKFTAVCVDKNDKTRTLALQKDMPIEIGPNGQVVYDGVDRNGNSYRIQNKEMGFWANNVQSDDAWMKRTIVKGCKIKYDFVPIVKHDGYYTHANNVKNMIGITYDVRKLQFKLQPMKSAFEQCATFLGIKSIDLRDGDMKISDMRFLHPEEGSFMMT